MFKKPELEVVKFLAQDVLTTSPVDEEPNENVDDLPLD